MPVKLVNDLPIKDTIDGVGTIADSISNNGTLVTLLSVFIGLFILFILLFGAAFFYLYKKSVDKTDKTDDMEKKVVGGMLEKISDHLVDEITHAHEEERKFIGNEIKNVKQELVPHEEKKDLIKLLIDTNLVFRDASEQVINAIGAYRVAIYVFHNGNKSSHGLPFIKVTCIHEMFTNKKTSSSRGRGHNNMPLHLFFEIANGIYRDPESNYIVNDVDKEIDENENRGVVEFVDQSPVKSFFINGIEDTNNIISGFSVAEFIKPMDFSDPDVYNGVKDALDIMNGTIRYIVSNEEFRNEYRVDN